MGFEIYNAEAYVDAYLTAAGIWDEKTSPLFRSVDRYRKITENPMTRTDVLRMVKRRALEAGLPYSNCCHTFRATGITAYLENGGTIENAQAIAAHESPRTTKLYQHTFSGKGRTACDVTPNGGSPDLWQLDSFRTRSVPDCAALNSHTGFP